MIRISVLLVLVGFAAALDLTDYNTPDAPKWADIVEKPRLAGWRALTVDAYAKRGQHALERDEEFGKLMEIACLQAAGIGVDESKIREVLNRAAVHSRHHPDKLAHWVNATIADGTTSRRSKLGQKRSDAVQNLFNDQVLGQLRYNPIILLPMLNDILQSWYFEPEAHNVRMAKGIMRTMRLSLHYGLAHSDEIAPEVLIQVIRGIRIRNIALDGGDLGAVLVSDFIPLIEKAELDPWLKDHLLAELYAEAAWAYRGGGWASTVTEDRWELFSKYYGQAVVKIESAYRQHPNAMSAARGLGISRHAGGTVSQEEWIDRAFRHCFDHPGVFSVLKNYLKPRWGGSWEELFELATAAHAADRYDSQLWYQPSSVIWTITHDAFHMQQWDRLKTFLGQPAVIAMINEWADKARVAQPEMARKITTDHGAMLWHAGLQEEAKEILKTVKGGEHKTLKRWWLSRDDIFPKGKAGKTAKKPAGPVEPEALGPMAPAGADDF
jgi:hypothetical protein